MGEKSDEKETQILAMTAGVSEKTQKMMMQRRIWAQLVQSRMLGREEREKVQQRRGERREHLGQLRMLHVLKERKLRTKRGEIGI